MSLAGLDIDVTDLSSSATSPRRSLTISTTFGQLKFHQRILVGGGGLSESVGLSAAATADGSCGADRAQPRDCKPPFSTASARDTDLTTRSPVAKNIYSVNHW